MCKSGSVLLALFGITVLLSGCSSNAPIAAEAALAPKPAADATSPPQTAPTDYIASGPIVVEDQVDLAAQRDGVVAEVFVETGTLVKKGQFLASLDDRQLWQLTLFLKHMNGLPPAPQRVWKAVKSEATRSS